jgi:hypothetical protein
MGLTGVLGFAFICTYESKKKKRKRKRKRKKIKEKKEVRVDMTSPLG